MTAKVFRQFMKEMGCCFLAICCPPGSPQQRAAFRTFAAGNGVIDEAQADELFDAAVAEGNTR
jgi:hypothetical protein